MSGLALIILDSSASAATPDAPVFHATDPNTAIEAVAAASELPQWQLQPFRLSDLDILPGLHEIHTAPRSCREAVTNERLRTALDLGVAKMRRRDYTTARILLGETADIVHCLDQPAEASVLARLFLEIGIANAVLINTSEAAAAFQRAIVFDPKVAWDDDHDPALSNQLEAARAALGASTQLPILRTATLEGVQLWVDGHPAPEGPLMLSPGDHLIQTLQPVFTLEVTLAPGDPEAMLSLVTELRDDLVVEIADPTVQATLAGTIAPKFGPKAYIWSGAEVWALENDLWQRLPKPTRATARSDWAGRLRLAGLSSLLVGATIAGIGSVFVLTTDPALELNHENGDEMVLRYGGTGLAEGGAAVAGVGILQLGISLAIGHKGAPKLAVEKPGAETAVP